MTRTALLLGALLTAGALAGPTDATAKPAPPCRQMQDPTGDAQILGANNPTGQPQAASLDVVSADFATTSKQLLAVIRLKSLAPDPTASLGSAYKLSWTVNGVSQFLMYRTFADGPPDAVFDADADAGTIQDLIPAGFTVNASTNEIALSLARKADAALRGASTALRFTNLAVQTYGGVNRKGGSSLTGYDHATQAKAYVDRTPTCLKGA